MYCNVHNNDADGVVTMVTTRNRTYCLKETAHIVSKKPHILSQINRTYCLKETAHIVSKKPHILSQRNRTYCLKYKTK